MFCPSCSAETKEGLRFCNRCGANLAPVGKTAPPRLVTLIVILSVAVTVTIVLGFLMIFFFAIELIGRNNDSAQNSVFLMLFTLVVLVVVWMIARQLSRLIGVYLETGDATTARRSTAATDAATTNASAIDSATITSPNLPPASTIPINKEELTRKFEENR